MSASKPNSICEDCVPTTKSVPAQKPIRTEQELKANECKTEWAAAEKCMLGSSSTDWRICKTSIYQYRECQKTYSGGDTK